MVWKRKYSVYRLFDIKNVSIASKLLNNISKKSLTLCDKTLHRARTRKGIVHSMGKIQTKIKGDNIKQNWWNPKKAHVMELTGVTRKLYDDLIASFDQDSNCDGYRETYPIPQKADSSDLKGIASEIYGFFHAHYFKVHRTLSNLESHLQTNGDSLYVSSLTIVDVGCSIGTATYAYLDSLQEKCRQEMCHHPHEIQIVFVEPNQAKVHLLKKCIQYYLRQLDSKYKVTYQIIQQYFPCIDDILKMVGQHKGNILIFMSNFVSWIKDENDLLKGFRQLNMHFSASEEIRCINVEAHKNAINRLGKIYQQFIEQGVYEVFGPEIDKSLSYINHKNTYFRDVFGNKDYKHGGFVYGSVYREPIINLLKNEKILKRSYFKARSAYRQNPLHDEIEIKLIGEYLGDVVQVFQGLIVDGYTFTNDFLQFLLPKNQDQNRPYVMEDFYNEMFTAALFLTWGRYIDQFHDRSDDEYSFGNRLEGHFDKLELFRWFVEQYFGKYLRKAEEYASSGQFSDYLQADIQAFYSHIDQQLLYQLVKKYFPQKNDWLDKTLRSFIFRNLKGCDAGKGLSQGSLLSTLLANVYLYPFDNWLQSEYPEVAYVRYVDDFFVFAKNRSQLSNVQKEIGAFLSQKLGLKVNEEKSKESCVKEYQVSKKDAFFEEVNSEADMILKTIYTIDKKNYKKYEKDPDRFIEIYHACLKELGIYVPLDWLSVKVVSRARLIDRLLVKFKGKQSAMEKWMSKKRMVIGGIKWGNIPVTKDKEAIEKWARKFKKKNASFMRNVEKLKGILKRKFIETYDALFPADNNNHQLEPNKEKELSRLLRFTCRKLMYFRVTDDDVISRLKNLLNKPWLKVYKTIRAYPELAESVKHMVQQDKEDFNSLVGIWLLGEMEEKSACRLIQEIFFKTIEANDDINVIKNTLAAEALMKIDLWGDFDAERLVKIIQSWLSRKEFPRYHLLRNAYLLLNAAGENVYLPKLIEEGILVWNKHWKVNLVLSWIGEHMHNNVMKTHDRLPSEMKKYLPREEPGLITYLS